MSKPRQWTPGELREDATASKAAFRAARLDEPLEEYAKLFDLFVPIFDQLIDRIGELDEEEGTPTVLAELMGDEDTKVAFRYLTGPPISEDDLKTLADAKLSPRALRQNPEAARRVRDTVLHILDPKRFPWIVGRRKPKKGERKIATRASAALIAAQKLQTKRRNEAKTEQEAAVKKVLEAMGFVEVPRREIQNLRDAPRPGTYCPECTLGDSKADIVAGLHDGRVLALECKTSNSEVNSFKRVNHEAAGKARSWTREFGARQVVPGAVLKGVFKADNLATAQGEGLALFWEHRLRDLREFIKRTQS